MKISRIVIAAAVAVSAVLNSVPVSAVSIEPRIVSGHVLLSGKENEDEPVYEYFYSDDYFSASGKELNTHLRTMSLCLAVSAFSDPESMFASGYAPVLLSDIGFSAEDTVAEQMEETPTADSIGTVISHKNTDHGEVIAVAVRGFGYSTEWVSNLDVGETGDAAGFSEAAHKVVGRIRSYEEKYGLSGAKIWMTGFSRGGGVSDLAGKYINMSLSDFGLTEDDIYIYTFEAPSVSGTENGFENIHNVVCENDIIPRFYSKNWGMYRSGVTESFRSEVKLSETGRQNDMLSGASSFPLADPAVISESKKAVPTNVADYSAMITDWLTTTVSRSEFDVHNDGICDFLSFVLDSDTVFFTGFAEYFKDVFAKAFTGDFMKIYNTMRILSAETGPDEAVNTASSMLTDALDSTDHSGVMSDEDFRKLRDAVPDFSAIAVPLMRSGEGEGMANILGLSGYFDEIIVWHFPDKIYELVKAEDNYYSPEQISGAEITVDETTADVVSVKIGNAVLAPGTDYSVTYRDVNGDTVEPAESGEYTAVVAGVGSYTGTAEKTFTAVFPHFHRWVFEQHGSEVSVRCSAKDCDYGTDKRFTVSLVGEDKVYDGERASVNAVISDGFPEEIGITAITFSGSNDAPYLPCEYTAEIGIYDVEHSDRCFSAELGLRIDPLFINAENTEIGLKENSSEIISVSRLGNVLEPEKDYSVRYFDAGGNEIEAPENAGNYSIEISGKNVYSGTVKKNISITDGTAVIIAVIASCAVIIAAVVVFAVFLSRKKKQKT